MNRRSSLKAITPNLRSVTAVAIASAAVLASALAIRAQDAAAPAPATPDAPESFLGKESGQSVYVRDSAVAVEKLALAARMERLKEWDKVADALQELVEKYPDRVVPSQTDRNNVIYQYTSVTRAVQERLAQLPPEGLEVYRARYETPAADLMASKPDDPATLHKVYSLYFVTDTGKAAAMALIDRYLEGGDFPAAAWLGDRLLKWHPSLNAATSADRPAVLFRTSLAYHLSGDDAAAKKNLEALQSKHADATGTVRGQEVALAETLTKELQVAPPVARAAAGDSWPMFGGDPSRSRVSTAAGRTGAKVYDVPYLPAPRRPGMPANPAFRRATVQIENRDREQGQMLGVMPAVDRGELFFQDNANVYARSLDSGLPLPGWASSYPDRNGVYNSPHALPLPRNHQMTVTVTDGEVLAVTGQVDRQMMAEGRLGPGERETRLVCLDRATGKERWVATTRQLPEPAAALRQLELGGSPLVAGDSVYVMARGGRAPVQFEDAYVLCFGLKDGKFRWSCYLASGNAAPNEDGGIGLMSDNVAHLAYASGRVYALTNLGAVGAVDAYNGTIVWLNLYPRPKPQFVDFRMRLERSMQATAPRPWEHNPVVVRDGKVFILPADGDHVLVYDAGTGVEAKRIPVADVEQARSLLAVVDDRMVLANANTVFCVKWPDFTPRADEYANLAWKKALVRTAEQPDSIRGRGFVTTESVFVPTSWAVHRISLKNGKVEQTYPKDRAWEPGEGPGNVVVTQDHVVVATGDRVNVYTDLQVAQAKLDAAVAADPKSPEPRLEYAELMFVAGQQDVAVQKLDEAVELLGGRAQMRPGLQRDRVFNVALTFAQRLVAAATGEGGRVRPSDEQRAMITGLFDRAGAAAASPSQHVNYRVSRARYAGGIGDTEAELRLYQEILADAQWRPVRLTAADDGSLQQAAAVAEKAVGEVLATPGGRAAYAPFEQAAQQQVGAATAAKDAAALLAVAQQFPNADAAPAAMLAAADFYEADGRHRQATQVLAQAYRKYRDRADRARLQEAMARNFLALPNGLGTAIGRLADAAKVPGERRLSKPLNLGGGKTVEAGATFAAALDALREHSEQIAARALPDFRLPVPSGRDRPQPLLPEDPRLVVDDVEALLVPHRDFARHDRVVTFTTGKGTSVFAVGSASPLVTTPAPGEQPKGAAWVGEKGEDLLLWGNTAVAMLDPRGAEPKWTVRLASLPEMEVAVGGVPAVDGVPGGIGNEEVLILENQVVRFRGRRRAGGIRVVGPMGVIQPPIVGAPVNGRRPGEPGGPNQAEIVEHVRPIGDRVVVTTSTGRVLAIEYDTGSIAWQTRLSLNSVHQLVANDEFAVARLVDEVGAQLVVLDAFTGQVIHRRSFGPEMGAGGPVNMALAPDGMLVFTLNNSICGKDLYDPGNGLNFQYPAGGESAPVYLGANMPEQLVIADGRVLAVSDNGMLVRVHSLETGKEVTKALATGVSNWAVKLHVVGPRLYVVTQVGIRSYRIDGPVFPWSSPEETRGSRNVRDTFIGRNHVVLLDQMTGRGEAADHSDPPRFRLLAFARYPGKPDEPANESGKLDYFPVVTHPAGISDQWQPVEGGFYYRTVDRKLHFLRGAAE